MTGKDRIIVALDVQTKVEAVGLAFLLKGHVGGFKIGKRICTAEGAPQMVKAIGADETFLDLKFHDIPKTVREAAEVAASLGIKMFNVHALGGLEMMQAAKKGVRLAFEKTGHRALVLAVTILTSHDEKSLKAVGLDPTVSISKLVKKLALLAFLADLNGVVCSPLEIKIVRYSIPDSNFVIVTPGIRDSNAPPDDQARTMTAEEAVLAGADYVVVGRPITAAANPVAAADAMAAKIDAAVLERSAV